MVLLRSMPKQHNHGSAACSAFPKKPRQGNQMLTSSLHHHCHQNHGLSCKKHLMKNLTYEIDDPKITIYFWIYSIVHFFRSFFVTPITSSNSSSTPSVNSSSKKPNTESIIKETVGSQQSILSPITKILNLVYGWFVCITLS